MIFLTMRGFYLILNLLTFGRDSEQNVFGAYVRAQCQAKCLKQYGNRSKQDSAYKWSAEYDDCSYACNVPTIVYEECVQHCFRIKINSTSCMTGCLNLVFTMERATHQSSEFRDLSVSNWTIIRNLRFVCMDFDYASNLTERRISSRKPATANFAIDLDVEKVEVTEPPVFILWIRQKIDNNVTSPLDFGHHSMTDDNSVAVFTQWNFVGTEIDSTFTIRYLWPKVVYQLRVQAVNSLHVGPSFNGHVFSFENDDIGRTTLDKIFAKSIRSTKSPKPSIQLSWLPLSPNPTCFYSLKLECDSFPTRASSVFQATTAFSSTFENIEYHQSCFISVEPIWNYSKTRLEKTISIRIPSCATVHNNDFDICAPGKIQNLTIERLQFTSAILLTWSLPKISEPFIEKFKVTYRTTSTSLKCPPLLNTIFTKERRAIISDLTQDCSYRLGISALTKGGEGIPVEENFTLRKVFEPNQQRVVFVRWMIVLAFALLCLPIIGGSWACYFLQSKAKKNAKKLDESEQCSRKLIIYDPKEFKQPLVRNSAYYESTSKLLTLDTLENSTLSSRFLIVESLLGVGEFGSVHRARCTHPRYPNVVAIKKVKDCEDKTEPRRHLENEIALMKFIGRHENVVSFFGSTYQPEMALTMEYCAYGNLKGYLPTIKSQLLAFKKPEISPGADSGYGHTDTLYAFPAVLPATESNSDVFPKTILTDRVVDSTLLLKFAHQIASGMEHIADLGLIHCDLAARNILVAGKNGGEKILKISDFGMCQVCWSDKNQCAADNVQSFENHKFPVRWMAPEMLPQCGRKANNRSDVWSYGIVLWEMASLGARLPYEQYHIFDVEMAHMRLVVEHYRLEKPENCSDQLHKIMDKCWQLKAHLRPSFGSIKRQLEKLLEENEYTCLKMFR